MDCEARGMQLAYPYGAEDLRHIWNNRETSDQQFWVGIKVNDTTSESSPWVDMEGRTILQSVTDEWAENQPDNFSGGKKN